MITRALVAFWIEVSTGQSIDIPLRAEIWRPLTIIKRSLLLQTTEALHRLETRLREEVAAAEKQVASMSSVVKQWWSSKEGRWDWTALQNPTAPARADFRAFCTAGSSVRSGDG